jgi:protein SCO1/2
MLRIVVVALVLLVAAMFLLPREQTRAPQPAVATVLPAPLALPAFALEDTAGRPFTNANLEGRYSLVFFGYTFCPDICPLTLQVLAAARAEIAAKAPELAPQVVFVSIDPHRDDAARLRDYLGNFDPSFIGATAADEKLEPLVKALGVTVHKTDVDGERYNMTHNGTVYLLGPDAQLRALFNASPLDAHTVASDYLLLRRSFERTAAP